VRLIPRLKYDVSLLALLRHILRQRGVCRLSASSTARTAAPVRICFVVRSSSQKEGIHPKPQQNQETNHECFQQNGVIIRRRGSSHNEHDESGDGSAAALGTVSVIIASRIVCSRKTAICVGRLSPETVSASFVAESRIRNEVAKLCVR
jgi:hypothetical protein